MPHTRDIFEDGIAASVDPVLVRVTEFAVLPDEHGEPATAQRLVDVPSTGRLFVATERGMLYAVSYDGAIVSPYLDITLHLDLPVLSEAHRARQAGLRGVAFHPQFAEVNALGFGRFYTLLEVVDTKPEADFEPGRVSGDYFDTVLVEWTTSDPAAWVYDGGSPRELMRIEQPTRSHNGGAIAFRPDIASGTDGYGLLYIALGDGGGVSVRLAQDLSYVYGKLLRIDPLGFNSANGRYGIPANNPFARDGRDDTLGEIYAYGLRNPNGFGWDVANGDLYVADIGNNMLDEINLVRAGDNLGWPVWEGSFRLAYRRALWCRWRILYGYAKHAIGGKFEEGCVIRRWAVLTGKRGDPAVSFPVVEYDRIDELFPRPLAAVTGVVVCRECAVSQLNGKVIFGDLPSGEVFYFSADDDLPNGGAAAIRRILLTTDGSIDDEGNRPRRSQGYTLLKLIQARNAAEGREQATRADLRFGTSAAGDVFLLNKGDGVIRRLQPHAGR